MSRQLLHAQTELRNHSDPFNCTPGTKKRPEWPKIFEVAALTCVNIEALMMNTQRVCLFSTLYSIPLFVLKSQTGHTQPPYFSKPVTLLQRLMNMSVICYSKFVLVLNIDGDMEVGSLGGFES
jgi:hypothetical protein